MKLLSNFFLLIILISNAFSETCLIDNFEDRITLLFDNKGGYCGTFSTWRIGNYSDSSTVKTPHKSSKYFLTPTDDISCISTHPISMSIGGVIEVNLFMDGAALSDEVTVIVNKMVFQGSDENVGHEKLTPDQEGFQSGWQSLRITLQDTENFEGYIAITGSSSTNSIVLIDSVRYIPPSLHEFQCPIYGREHVEMITRSQTRPESCVTYDFEQDYLTKFSDTLGTCSNIKVPWILGNYSSHMVESPNSSSKLFISPREQLSCITSFPFRMAAGGTIEINIFMTISTQMDYVVVFVHEMRQNGNDLVVANLFPTQGTDGWQTLKSTLTGTGNYNGYITFMGVASDNSAILIDSFRYTPPYVVDREQCPIYGIMDEPEESETAPVHSDVCVTYDFEQDFDTLFSSQSALCPSVSSSWKLKNYNTLKYIQMPDPSSNWFMSPKEEMSCISSFSFKMAGMGIIETNVFVNTTSVSDYLSIIVTAQFEPNGNDIVVVGMITFQHEAGNSAGWKTLRTSLFGTGLFEGRINFLSSSSKHSIILVDSFRYIPRTYQEEECVIYEKISETATTGITSFDPAYTELTSTLYPNTFVTYDVTDYSIVDSEVTYSTPEISETSTRDPVAYSTTNDSTPEISETSTRDPVAYSTTNEIEITDPLTLIPEVTYTTHTTPNESETKYPPTTLKPEVGASTITFEPDETYSPSKPEDTYTPSTLEAFTETSTTLEPEVTTTNSPPYEPEISTKYTPLPIAPEVSLSTPSESYITKPPPTLDPSVTDQSPITKPPTTDEPENETTDEPESETEHPIIDIPDISELDLWLLTIIVALLGLIFLIMLICCCCCCYKCGKKKGSPTVNIPSINITNNTGNKHV